MHKGIQVIFLFPVFLLHTNARGQDVGRLGDLPPNKVTFEQLAKSAKVYFRDTTEFPMTQRTTLLVSDSLGHVRKIKNQSLDYIFNGYNRGNKTATGRYRGEISFWDRMRGAKTFKASLNSFFWMTFPEVILYTDTAEEYVVESWRERESKGLLRVKLTPVKPCPKFTMDKNPESYFPDEGCGISEFQLLGDLSFQKFALNVPGLPSPARIDPFGQCTLKAYRAEVEFQKIMLPGDKEPFLVPKQVTSTLETNKGNVVIKNVYEAKQKARE